MIPNHSPWINQLKRTRPVVPLAHDLDTDVAIVGGGIAGAVTAFFTLRDTDQRVVLLEADKVAHGATGHNAGQITSYFERPFFDLVQEFGLDLAAAGQRAVESGWQLLEEICDQAKLQTPRYRFTGYAGCTTEEQILNFLKNSQLRFESDLPPEQVTIAAEWLATHQLPTEYKNFYNSVAQSNLLELLETKNQDYIAFLSFPKGCLNSALFTEELVGYLLATYADRFALYEESPMTILKLQNESVELAVLDQVVRAKRAVLCTNGFENFTIKNEGGPDINTEFHQVVSGRIGYMIGYFEPYNESAIAISYFPKDKAEVSDPTGDPYYYVTRRPHEHENKESYNLVCAGGPDKVLPNLAIYSRLDSCSEAMRAEIDDFLRANYRDYPEGEVKYAFCWHGLMGYTPNGVRRIGPEPCNPNLLYNLGCNGVGILPSIYGGKRISEFLRDEVMTPSIFDPHDQRT